MKCTDEIKHFRNENNSNKNTARKSTILTNATHKYYQNETVVVSEKNRQC